MVIPPLAAEKIFQIGNFPITNSYINSTIVVALIFVVGLITRRLLRKNEQQRRAPKGFLIFSESLMDLLLSYMNKVPPARASQLNFCRSSGLCFSLF